MKALRAYQYSESLKQLPTLGVPAQNLAEDVSGAPLGNPVQWRLALSSRLLSFSAQWQHPVATEAESSVQFTDGLYEGDCAELFLLNPETGYYLEINLSPVGAWWSCLFEAPRARAASWPKPLQGARTSSYAPKNLAVFVAPLPKLRSALALDAHPEARLHGNVTLCQLDDAKALRYASVAALPEVAGGAEGAVDFHQPAAFLPLQLKSL